MYLVALIKKEKRKREEKEERKRKKKRGEEKKRGEKRERRGREERERRGEKKKVQLDYRTLPLGLQEIFWKQCESSLARPDTYMHC